MTEVFTFAELIRDGVLEIGDGYRAKNEELGGNGPVFLRAAYLQDSGFVRNMPERFQRTDFAFFGPKVAQLGDVVITTKGNSTGRIGIIREPQVGAIYSPHLSYWRSRDHNRLDQGYLQAWALSVGFSEQLPGLAYSTDMAPYLSLRDQGRLSISLPPISQQRLVARYRTALDDKIDLNRRTNETLEAMARALFRDWFVDFGPTRAKMEGRAPYLDADTWALFPERLDEEGKPEGWRGGHASDLIVFNPREALPKGLETPYLDMAALPTGSAIAQVPVRRPFASGSKFRNGDALLARITPCLENGKTAFVTDLQANEVGWGSTEFIVMRALPPVPRPFSYLLARYERFREHAIRSMTGTSGRQRADAQAIAQFPLSIPDDAAIWSGFSELVDPIFALVAQNSVASRTLAETRDLLLPKLMSGEIRVRDVEAVL
ncbi:hypothetical protein [Salinarimonas sp.]|uniref:restriction endonuclease subunit S n=1 Tax=Salinarimonas sp. TaxID=2766526 RepID=UPI0032D969A8